jgi:hypothetical protein
VARTWENEASELCRVDAATGEVAEVVEMPAGMAVSGLESDGADRFFCGGGSSGKVRVVRKRAERAVVAYFCAPCARRTWRRARPSAPA